MEQVQQLCQKHHKQYQLFCTDDSCTNDRMLCFICFHGNQKHSNHKVILIDQFMEYQDDIMNNLFGKHKMYWQDKGQLSIESFKKKTMKLMHIQNEVIITEIHKILQERIEKFEDGLNKLCSKIDVQDNLNLKSLQEKMQLVINNNTEELQEQFKKAFDQFNNNDEFNQISLKLEGIMQEIESMNQKCIDNIRKFDQDYEVQVNKVMKINQISIEQKKEIRQSAVEIQIYHANKLDEYLETINKNINDKKQIRILLNLWSNITHFDDRKQTLEWIKQNKLQKHVFVVWFRLKINTVEQENQLLNSIIDKCFNVYHVNLGDYSDSIDDSFYQVVFKMVKEYELLHFRIYYNNNNDSQNKKQIMKQFNNIVKKYQDLDGACYCLGGMINKSSEKNREQTVSIINEISNL